MPRGDFTTSMEKRQKLLFSKMIRLHNYVVVTDAKGESLVTFKELKDPLCL